MKPQVMGLNNSNLRKRGLPVSQPREKQLRGGNDMMFNKVQTVGTVSEFLSGGLKYKRVLNKTNRKLAKIGMKVAITVIASSLFLDITTPLAFAAQEVALPSVKDTFGSAVNTALQPLIDVLKEIAKPIAGVMVTWGSLRFMIGQQEQGIANMQQAAIGYILVQLSPIILKLITGVGDAVA